MTVRRKGGQSTKQNSPGCHHRVNQIRDLRQRTEEILSNLPWESKSRINIQPNKSSEVQFQIHPAVRHITLTIDLRQNLELQHKRLMQIPALHKWKGDITTQEISPHRLRGRFIFKNAGDGNLVDFISNGIGLFRQNRWTYKQSPKTRVTAQSEISAEAALMKTTNATGSPEDYLQSNNKPHLRALTNGTNQNSETEKRE